VVTVSLLLRSAETVHGRSDRAAHLAGPGGPGRLLLAHHERLLGRAEAEAGQLGGGRAGGGSQRGGRAAREHAATAGRTHRPEKRKKYKILVYNSSSALILSRSEMFLLAWALLFQQGHQTGVISCRTGGGPIRRLQHRRRKNSAKLQKGTSTTEQESGKKTKGTGRSCCGSGSARIPIILVTWIRIK
jgi:hypothetical protein